MECEKEPEGRVCALSFAIPSAELGVWLLLSLGAEFSAHNLLPQNFEGISPISSSTLGCR